MQYYLWNHHSNDNIINKVRKQELIKTILNYLCRTCPFGRKCPNGHPKNKGLPNLFMPPLLLLLLLLRVLLAVLADTHVNLI